MKQATKLTRNQKEAVSAYNLNPNEWMCYKNDPSEAHFGIVHKVTGKRKLIDRYARRKRGL